MATQFDNFDKPVSTDEVVFSARELTVLNEIATVVSSATDISDVYSSFSALVADVIEWDGIIVNTPCEDGRNFLIRVREGSAVSGREAGDIFPIEGSLYGEVQKTHKSVVVSVGDGQTAEWALKIPGLRGSILAGYRTFLATPLISQGELLGAIYVQSFDTGAFSDHDRLVFERIATFVAPAIERFNAYERLQKDELHARSLLKIGRMLLGARSLDDVFSEFVEELKTVVQVDRLAIAVASANGESVIDRFIYGVPVEGYVVNNVIPLDSLEPNGLDVTSHGYVMPNGALSEADPVTSPGLHANFKAGLKSAMFAGLQSQGRLVGTINVKSLQDDAYSASDLKYFEQVADHLAASLDRTLSHESEIETSIAAQERIQSEQEAMRVVDVIQAKERLLTSASHELRTPLTGILAFVDLLARNRNGNLTEKELRYLSIVRRNAEDLSGKVHSLIAHAARDAGELNIRLEKFDLATMLREAITDAAPKLAGADQRVELDVPEDYEAIGDRHQLLVALGHLIDNAVRHAPRDSVIRVSGGVEARIVQISVSDEGVGVSDEYAPDIFDPFERGVLTGMADSPGAGLGLTYVRAVAVAHGGDATYGRSAEGGARFTISIPVRTETGG
jgi:signal transduction histidine kinase